MSTSPKYAIIALLAPFVGLALGCEGDKPGSVTQGNAFVNGAVVVNVSPAAPPQPAKPKPPETGGTSGATGSGEMKPCAMFTPEGMPDCHYQVWCIGDTPKWASKDEAWYSINKVTKMGAAGGGSTKSVPPSGTKTRLIGEGQKQGVASGPPSGGSGSNEELGIMMDFDGVRYRFAHSVKLKAKLPLSKTAEELAVEYGVDDFQPGAVVNAKLPFILNADALVAALKVGAPGRAPVTVAMPVTSKMLLPSPLEFGISNAETSVVFSMQPGGITFGFQLMEAPATNIFAYLAEIGFVSLVGATNDGNESFDIVLDGETGVADILVNGQQFTVPFG